MPAESARGVDDERGVVDRIVEGVAVVLVGEDEVEHHLDAAELPDETKEGTWLRVRRSGHSLIVLGRDEEGETRQRQQIEGRLDQLRQQRRGGRFTPPGD